MSRIVVDLSDHNANRYPILRGPAIAIPDAADRTATCGNTPPAS